MACIRRSRVYAVGIVVAIEGGAAHGAMIEQAVGQSPGATPLTTLGPLGAGTHLIDLSGLTASQAQANASNSVIELALDPNARIVGVGWSLNLSMPSPGVLSDLLVGVVNQDGDGVRLRPAEGVNAPGTLVFDSPSTPTVDLGALAFDADRAFVELYTSFPGVTGEFLTRSVVWVEVEIIPAPGSAVLLAGVLAVRRRR